ncbi:peptidoglycan-binding domain-containing protein [Streptomyces sp. NPDC001857]|uniref:peptidoglycan-binding domain-containing protein n=2 Tax=unclassified Streptomyces TaxID=2593676 RepID=UPI003328709C
MPTPDGPGQPHEREVLEPIRVLRPRNTDALAQMFREMTEDADLYEAVPLPPPRQPGAEADTEEIPPVSRRASRRERVEPTRRRAAADARRPPGEARPDRDRTAGPHRIAIVSLAVLAAALVGFACALLLPGRAQQAAAQPAPAAPAPTAAGSAPIASPEPSAPADPDGAGTLREGDTGAEVIDLQQRLRRIPNVYDGGATDGRYDSVLTEAVARFQLWYGIRGDESGVYGDDTRRDLESRTG